MKNSPGCLYLVATPIGNLADITFRAIDTLKSVDFIAAEDTRHSQTLLFHYGIKTPLIALHAHNEQQRVAELLPQLQAGKQIALISDAGTPLISDPGYRFVQAMHQAQIKVIPIPGACAAISALVASGLPTDRFIFEGFLPVKNNARRQRLVELSTESRTVVLYEAPHRIEDLLALLVETWGAQRLATIARELTKTFETIRQDTLVNLQTWVLQDPNQRKGEFVMVLHGAEATTESTNDIELKKLLQILLAELPLKQAVTLAAKITQQNRNPIYQMALQFQKSENVDK